VKTPDEAAARAIAMVGKLYPYVLGTGNKLGPSKRRRDDGTWSPLGFDCWGFVSLCYDIERHRPGYNKQPKATVSDDVNCDSAIEQAEHVGATDRLWKVVATPRIGDLLVMPSIRDARGKRIRIGHVWLVVGVPAEWDEARPQYDLLDTVQCQASTKPAIKRGPGPRSDASTFRGLTDEAWRVRLLRVVAPG
jgi:hypothetical protein